MYQVIFNLLNKYLPNELIYMILFKYGGLKHPIMDKCFNHRQHASAVEDEFVYYIWNQRKKNNFSDNIFFCLVKYGNELTFVSNKKDQICENKLRRKYRLDSSSYDNYYNKYGLIHYFNNTWLFPTNCNNTILIHEIYKNIPKKEHESLYLENKTKKELINFYFKL